MSILFHRAHKLDAKGLVSDFWMTVDGDTITAVGSGGHPNVADSVERIDVEGRWLVPGFIDLHCHGGGGHSFDGDAAEIRGAIAAHRAQGTTRSVLSLVANPRAQLVASLSLIADICEDDPTVLGSHLEGPFLADSRKGAHNPAYLRSPSPDELGELLEASRGTLRQLTLAPELDGAGEAIDLLVDAAVVVAIGHTSAGFELAKKAFDRGARILTHAFNSMAGIHHRAPGPVIAAFEDDRVTLELVLDGHHVHPDIARLAFRSAPRRVALITDAMAAAGSADGQYHLGSLPVTVKDGIATISGSRTIAGSTLTQDRALRLAITRAGIPPEEAIAALTSTPASALGLGRRFGYLEAGYAADAVILDMDFEIAGVWANGTAV